jgi:hypothetical protein
MKTVRTMTRPTTRKPSKATGNRIRIEVAGYKSLRDPVAIDIRPLTVISGTNSSGKTSFMQAVLLLKQTLDAQFDPGPLLLNGPNVALTSTRQLFSRGKSKDDIANQFRVNIHTSRETVELAFDRPVAQAQGINLAQMNFGERGGDLVSVRSGQVIRQFKQLPKSVQHYVSAIQKAVEQASPKSPDIHVDVIRDRCFLEMRARAADIQFGLPIAVLDEIKSLLLETIHVPGLRGNPERVYPRSAVGKSFPGAIQTYVASLIHAWQASNLLQDADRLATLNQHLVDVGLTWKVQARPIDDATVELLVGRMPHAQQGGAHDLVSIADVGFGVSQVLPVLVALVAARPGQLVYVEQPEIHLHPRAQTLLASIFAQHAKRGVIIVVETHSSLLIRGIQTAVAEGRIPARSVALHWFSRAQATGYTVVDSAQVDSIGRFGDWPVDFDDVSMAADVAYFTAAEARLQ